MELFSDRGSTPLTSTRWTLHEHLLFQRRLCRKGVAVMSTQNQRVKVLMYLGLRFFYILVPDWDSAPNHNRQTAASNASVNTHSPFLLVGNYAPTPAERSIHSAAARFAYAFEEGRQNSRPFAGMKRIVISKLSEGLSWNSTFRALTQTISYDIFFIRKIYFKSAR